MRQFVAGAIIGSLLTVAGTLLWMRSTATTQTASTPRPAPTAATHSEYSAQASTARLSASDEREWNSKDCVVITESNEEQISTMLLQRLDERRARSLREEPQDPLWAPSMEQQIRMLVAQHPWGSRFNLLSVDCHTVYCLIKAEVPISPDPGEGIDAFHKVAESLQERLEMRVGGSGSGGMLPNGMVDAHAMLRR